MIYEAALQDFQTQTGIVLDKHPLVGQLLNCDTVVTASSALYNQIQGFSEFREKDKVLKPLKNVISIMCKHNISTNFGLDLAWDICLVRTEAPIGCSMSLTSPYSVSYLW